MDERAKEHIRGLARELREAERSVRILRSLAWAPEVKARFLERGGRELPVAAYAAYDATPVVEAVARVRAVLPEGPVGRWLGRTADAIESGARMLAEVGRPAFFEHARRLYGEPGQPHLEGGATALELARAAEALHQEIAGLDLGAPPPACHLAERVAQRMRQAARRFGEQAPAVEVVDALSANALAGPRRIRLRRGAQFSDRDVLQLIHHEAFVHVATSLNGQAQVDLPILAAGHAGTTRTQEGLAVLAEFISGAMDPLRFRRLASRVLAIQMAIEGADFLEVYRFFLERSGSEDQAFEDARRVFRGGVLTGGAPYTKDVVYLDGLLGVTNFLRAAVAEGRADSIVLLFCGKLAVRDVPAVAVLAAEGLCCPPRYLPPWVEDRRFLVTYLAYSSFLDRVDLRLYRERARHMLAEAPVLKGFGAGSTADGSPASVGWAGPEGPDPR